MQTVRDELTDLATEWEVPAEELIAAKMADALGGLSARFRRLIAQVLLRLPASWDSHACWEIKEEETDVHTEIEKVPESLRSIVDHLYAGARQLPLADREDFIQEWEMVLTPRLAQLSDPAACWVIAHEFGHVASALPTDTNTRNEDLCEDRADAIASWWGFDEERRAFERENKELLAE
jgi:hypothetical protein